MQVCWAMRGQHAGLSLTKLATLAERTPEAAQAQVFAAQRYLARVGSPWQVACEDLETEDGAAERYFWLTAPHCPRPRRRILPELHEPELISWDDVEETYPVLPRWES